ncbi:MAG: hypothetical protein II401_10895 [Bacteroidales bacterium]|nr:hypothetical protein [Bacteroidales bacterium]
MENTADNMTPKTRKLAETFIEKFDFYMFRCKSPVTYGQMIKARNELQRQLKATEKSTINKALQ